MSSLLRFVLLCGSRLERMHVGEDPGRLSQQEKLVAPPSTAILLPTVRPVPLSLAGGQLGPRTVAQVGGVTRSMCCASVARLAARIAPLRRLLPSQHTCKTAFRRKFASSACVHSHRIEYSSRNSSARINFSNVMHGRQLLIGTWIRACIRSMHFDASFRQTRNGREVICRHVVFESRNRERRLGVTVRPT
ncbi:hypothetical protein X994_6571 (plasmid) [Burkholderia pseudomallei]|uniref:Uncharacterized protein n=1 Tax=Burkholderia pseudomallei TaxID=28450 RepID=A0AA40MH93_BURPE|nr:hypothetical protein X994_6571 [Burkholderia pseudomallei]KGD54887.1 hypothetical protein DP49_5886 [Burkholderia pseudomallei]KGW74900.1 hypothetical protein Y046_5648 [Burkholderia pseudomallei MSHR2990]KGX17295.1 hypothetical protein Y036_6189 [Burkholderia pseudomallei]